MGKKLNDDVLKFIVDIDGKPAQHGLNLVEKETRKLEKSNRELVKEMAKLEAKGKKGTEEWKQYDKQVKKNNSSITAFKKKQDELIQKVGVTNLTMSQLRKEYTRLRRAQNGANPNSAEWKRYDKQLKAVKTRLTQLNGAQKKTNSLFGSLKTLMPAMGIGAAIGLFSSLKTKIFDTRAEFEKYEAVLTNSLGSQKAAQKEMGMLVEFAAKTPFQLNELTGSFVKLTNYGIKPTREEMTLIGDTASSVGKSFDQYVEAIANGIMGESESLKEFGIKAKKHGDTISYTFKGVTTEVKNNADAIKDYLYGLGKMQGVAGSMAAISKTMGGQASNLADNFDRLWNNLGQGVAGDIIKDSIGWLNKMTDSLNNVIENKSSQADTIRSVRIELNKELGILKTGNFTTDERARYIKKINDEYKDYLPNLIDEKASLEDIEKLQGKINEHFVQKILYAEYEDEMAALIRAQKASIEFSFVQKSISAEMLGSINDNAAAMSFWNEVNQSVADVGGQAADDLGVEIDGLDDKYKQLATSLGISWEEIKKTFATTPTPGKDDKSGENNPKKLLTIEEIERIDKESLNAEEDEEDSYDPGKDPEIQMWLARDQAELERKEKKKEAKKEKKEADINDAEIRNAQIQAKIQAHQKGEDKIAATAKLKRQERIALMQQGLDIMSQAVNMYYTFVTAQMNRELKAAGDNERKKDQIRHKYAEKQRKTAKAQVWINAAQAVLGTWSGYSSMGIPGTILAGIQTAFILGTAAAQSSVIEAQEFAQGNLQEIIGRQTGRKYKATVSDGRSGLYSKPTIIPGLGIVGENDTELVLSGSHTRNIQNNYPELMDAIVGTMPEFATGNVSTTQTTNNNIMETGNIEALLGILIEEQRKPKKNFVSWTDIQDKKDEYDDLMDDVSAGQ